jgi:hypothetical protein
LASLSLARVGYSQIKIIIATIADVARPAMEGQLQTNPYLMSLAISRLVQYHAMFCRTVGFAVGWTHTYTSF